MPLTVFAAITARPGAEDALKQGLLALIHEVRTEPACRYYELFQSAERPEQFIMSEIWDDEAGLQAHTQMPHMKAFADKAQHWLAAPVVLTKLKS